MKNLKINKKCRCELLSYILKYYNDYFKRAVDPYLHKGKRKINNNYYPFIPTPSCSTLGIVTVLDSLLLSIKKGTRAGYEPRFIDCGCGVGNIVLLAKALGYVSHGIEYDGKTCNIARKLVPNDCHIIRSNITKFRRYGNYDVIYFYVPIMHEEMDIFVNRIHDKAKVGAYILSYGYNPKILFRSKKFKHIPIEINVDAESLGYNTPINPINIYRKV